MNFKDKIVLITGAASGIGRAAALAVIVFFIVFTISVIYQRLLGRDD